MILNRYIQRSIYLGTLGALLLLVSLSLFFVFVRELDDLGKGSYGLRQAMEFVLYSLPGNAVEFLPLAVLLGSILSLGALAANSEIIAMQASGMPICSRCHWNSYLGSLGKPAHSPPVKATASLSGPRP